MPRGRTGSTELDALARELKSNYVLRKMKSGHWAVQNRLTHKDVLVDGKILSLTGTAHGGRALNNMRAQLKHEGLLKGEPVRKPRAMNKEEREVKSEQMRAASAALMKQRQETADALHERLTAIVEKVGGWEIRGMQSDLAHVAVLIGKQQGKDVYPDLLQPSISRVHKRGWIEPRYQEIWNELAERLENADDLQDLWFSLVRESRGIPEELVEAKPVSEGEWPFKVELIPIDRMFADHDYQRPVPWDFVRKLAARYDETLVGTIDVSSRKRGATFAILDGQLRYEASKLKQKTALWCSIYEGLDKASEARFFLHKNRDRKVVHIFYTFMARVVAEDPEAVEMKKLTEKYAYRISIVSAAHDERNISAIAALEQAQKLGVLEPVLVTLKGSTYGRVKGQDSNLIRGLSYVHAAYPNGGLDLEHLQEVIANRDVPWLLGRAREGAGMNNSSVQHYMARVLVEEYNRGRRSAADRLSPDRLFQR